MRNASTDWTFASAADIKVRYEKEFTEKVFTQCTKLYFFVWAQRLET